MIKSAQKILVVDDEHHYFLRVIQEELKAHGYEVSRAFGCDEALWRVKKDQPDIVILDIMMKGMEGTLRVSARNA